MGIRDKEKEPGTAFRVLNGLGNISFALLLIFGLAVFGLYLWFY